MWRGCWRGQSCPAQTPEGATRCRPRRRPPPARQGEGGQEAGQQEDREARGGGQGQQDHRADRDAHQGRHRRAHGQDARLAAAHPARRAEPAEDQGRAQDRARAGRRHHELPHRLNFRGLPGKRPRALRRGGFFVGAGLAHPAFRAVSAKPRSCDPSTRPNTARAMAARRTPPVRISRKLT